MAEDFLEFKIRLVKIMEECGMSQADLCRKTGLATSMVSNYCAGRRTPSVQVAAKIAEALNTSIDYLASGKSYKQKQLSTDSLIVAENHIKYKSNYQQHEQSDDETLLNMFHALNSDGKARACSYLLDLTCIDKYKKLDEGSEF